MFIDERMAFAYASRDNYGTWEYGRKMRAIIYPDRIVILGTQILPKESGEPLLDELRAEHVPSWTPVGKRHVVVPGKAGATDTVIYRTHDIPDKEITRILAKHGIPASIEHYKSEIAPLCPVAIKLEQHEVRAPEHETWRVVSCTACEDRFAIGPHRIYGARITETEAVKQLESLLAADHRANRAHPNSYEFAD